MVNTYKLKFTLLQQEILELLMIKAGHSMNQRSIARYLDVSQPAIQKALPELIKQNFILAKQDTDSKRWAVELNRNNHKIMQRKRTHNLKQFYESGLADFLEEKFAGGTIILFGSYSRGEDTITSDIDIAIIGRKEKDVNLSLFEKKLERKIFINFYDSFKKIHRNLQENLCNGMVLVGGIEL